ncbi:hypothetical protein AAV96_16475 [Acinetobacter sp. AG1]|uniref:hypothetical protein n=1 Tax=Acinetobacter TaxID=469 RepID=UPI00062952FA|nr:hypothetical protein [Acinetobacter sp. AG1]KKW75619.1 hypothetical protein AAV96_16475 [Acinetobacter sp. AG1]
MQLEQDESLLIKTIPFSSLSSLIYIIIGTPICLFLFKDPVFLWLLFFLPVFLTNRLIITNKRISLRMLFKTRTIKINELHQKSYLIIDPYVFKKYEWQRKLLGQDFQKFWHYRTNIYFSQDENRHKLSQLRLSLFSKRQTDKILAILTQAWNLDSNIKQPD